MPRKNKAKIFSEIPKLLCLQQTLGSLTYKFFWNYLKIINLFLAYSSIGFLCFTPGSSILFTNFLNVFPSGKYMNLACLLLYFDQVVIFPYL